MGSFIQRIIRFDIELNNGTYENKGNANVVTIENVRANVIIDFAGGASVTSAQAMIWGLDKKLMDKLTVYPPIANALTGNKISISVNGQQETTGTTSNKTGQIYTGDIFRAYADYSNAPDVPFIIETTINMSGALKETEPLTFENATDVVSIVEAIAEKLGNSFVNDNRVGDKGVYLSNQYYSGTPMQMLRKVQQDANIDIYYAPPTIHVCLKNQPIATAKPFLISAQTGLIGWPMMDINGMINVNVLYNTSLFHGAEVELQSSLPNCNGKFYIVSMSVVLESLTPSGQWTASLKLANFQLMTPQAV